MFTFYSNGILSKIINGRVKRSIDLKKVVKSIRVKSAIDYVLKKGNNNNNNYGYYSGKNANSNIKELSSTNSIGNTNQRCLFNRSDLFNSSFKIDLSDAMLMSIPLKAGSKKSLTLLFEHFEKLEYYFLFS